MKYLRKYCNYPLTTMQRHRFASCETIVSLSQTSSLPPPPIHPHPATVIQTLLTRWPLNIIRMLYLRNAAIYGRPGVKMHPPVLGFLQPISLQCSLLTNHCPLSVGSTSELSPQVSHLKK